MVDNYKSFKFDNGSPEQHKFIEAGVTFNADDFSKGILNECLKLGAIVNGSVGYKDYISGGYMYYTHKWLVPNDLECKQKIQEWVDYQRQIRTMSQKEKNALSDVHKTWRHFQNSCQKGLK